MQAKSDDTDAVLEGVLQGRPGPYLLPLPTSGCPSRVDSTGGHGRTGLPDETPWAPEPQSTRRRRSVRSPGSQWLGVYGDSPSRPTSPWVGRW